MGSGEDGKSSKPEKSPSPTPDHGNAHVYLDWAAIQAYYGHRVAMPPYFNSGVPHGHAPPHPYVWGPPQPMMPPPYGMPYATVYAHGGVYAHPGIPIGSHTNGQDNHPSGAVNEIVAAAASAGMDGSGKSSGNADRGLIDKLKGFDGLAMSIGNGNGDGAKRGAELAHSQSMETDGSSDGSNAGVGEKSKKGSRETTPNNNDKAANGNPAPAGESEGQSKKVTLSLAVVTPSNSAPNMTTTLDLRSVNVKASPPINVPQLGLPVPNETWPQNERELKREKRKQSNRESARRSRLRKQAETEELAKRVQSLTAENVNLKSEINKLADNSKRLRLENVALTKRLKTEGITLGKIGVKAVTTTANLLDCVDKNGEEEEEGEMCERKNSSRTKLHQLLDASNRADAVAAR